MLVSQQLTYYFYSALLQANAAIFSIIGVFYIFRIQSFKNSISIIKSNVMEDRGKRIQSGKVLDWEELSITEMEQELKNSNSNYLSYKTHFRKWLELKKAIRQLKTNILLPLIVIALAVILNTVSLFLSDYCFKYNSFEFWTLINLIFEIIIVCIIVYSVIKLIATD